VKHLSYVNVKCCILTLQVKTSYQATVSYTLNPPGCDSDEYKVYLSFHVPSTDFIGRVTLTVKVEVKNEGTQVQNSTTIDFPGMAIFQN